MTGVDWSPLAASDPVPGDPAAIQVSAARYEREAQDVGDQVQLLRRTGRTGHWEGSAAQAFQARLGPLPGDLDLVGARFQRVAQALRDYATALERAQRLARHALIRARVAQESAVKAAMAVTGVITDAQAGSADARFVGPQPAGPLDAHRTGPLSFGNEDPELAAARRVLAAACAERDRAARLCSRAIRAAGHDRLHDPSRWQRLLGAVSTWAGLCSAWLGVAALALCVVPGLGPLLGAASLALALVQLAADTTRALADGGSWGAVGVDVLGVLPLGRAARLGAAMSRAGAVERAAAHAAIPRLGSAAAGRGLQRLAASPVRFERSRGLHGLAQVAATRPGRDVAANATHLVEAVRSSRAVRSLPALLRSPGGLLHEIAQVRREGAGAVLWLSGGHAAEVAQATVGVPFAPAPSGVA